MLDQKQLAELIGIDQSNVSRYERGLKIPSLPELECLITLLGMEPETARQAWQFQMGPFGTKKAIKKAIDNDQIEPALRMLQCYHSILLNTEQIQPSATTSK